jgi:metallo-beta-lactamase family protein
MGKKDKVKVSFCGMNASEVTGSMTLIEYGDIKILCDAGLYQSNNVIGDFKINSRKFTFNPKEINYIFISHVNIDHFGLLPRLYNEGCTAQIITYYDSVDFIQPMLEDSAHIMDTDMIRIRKKMPNANPIYTNEDVRKVLPYIRGYDSDSIHALDNVVSFELFSAGHIIGSCQSVIYIKENSGHITKIGVTGDIGNIVFNNPFINDFKPIVKCNILIGECTYNDASRSGKKKDRDKDIEKLKATIDTICNDRNGRVLIPSFALQRTQTILKVLYDIFGEDESFDLPIIIDSPLAVKLTKIFKSTLIGEQKELIEKITSWENVKMITDSEESKACVADKSPKIILSSSGMINAGRSKHYVKDILPRSNDCIIFCGYTCEGTIGWKIKNESEQKTITIDGKPYKNKCQVVNLKSFSSHMQHDELLMYYKNVANNGCDAIYLVHGDDGKIAFKKELEEEIRKINKTTKVVAVNKSTSVSI